MLKLLAYLPIILLPTYLIRIPLCDFGSTNLLDLLLILSTIYIFILLFKKSNILDILKILKSRQLLITFVILSLAGFSISYLANFNLDNWLTGLGIIKSFLVLPIIYSLALFLGIEKNILKIRALLFSIFILSSTLGMLGYIYSVNGILTYDNRLSLFFESPNQLSMLLVSGILTGLILSMKKMTSLKTFFVYLGMAASLFSLYLCHSLGAWLGLLFSIIFIVIIKFFNNYITPLKAVYFYLIIIFSLVVFFTPQLSTLVDHQENVPASAIDSRVVIYSVTQKIIINNWIVGIGPGNYQDKYLSEQNYFFPFPQWAVPHAHNNLIHFFAEGGIIALIGLLGIIFYTFFKTKKPFIGFELLVIYLLFHGCFDTTIWRNDTATMWWVMVFLCSHLQNKSI